MLYRFQIQKTSLAWILFQIFSFLVWEKNYSYCLNYGTILTYCRCCSFSYSIILSYEIRTAIYIYIYTVCIINRKLHRIFWENQIFLSSRNYIFLRFNTIRTFLVEEKREMIIWSEILNVIREVLTMPVCILQLLSLKSSVLHMCIVVS